MKAEVAALAEAFTLAIHEAVRQEIMEEMRAFSQKRQKREVRLRKPPPPPSRRKRKAKRRRVKRPVPYDRTLWRKASMVLIGPRLPIPKEVIMPIVDPSKPPVVMVSLAAPRAVVVRLDGKRDPNVALLLARSEDGEFLTIRLAQGMNRRYSKKARRILAAELLRDATDREAVLGRVPFDSVVPEPVTPPAP